jgi:hypothetical protein
MLSKFSVARLTFNKEKVMNIHPQAQGIASILRAEIEAFRRAGNLSREGFAASVMDAHQAMGGEAATGVDFSFVGDTYTQAKKAAQKLFRWLDDGGTLPAGMVRSVLQALPSDVRLHCLNQMYRPLGVEVRSLEPAKAARFDGFGALQIMIKETSEAQSAILTAAAEQTPESIHIALKEVSEVIQVHVNVKRSLESARLDAEQGA